MAKLIPFNKKSLANHIGISERTFRKQLDSLLKDRSVKKKFRKYEGHCFTKKQLQIIHEELGYDIPGIN